MTPEETAWLAGLYEGEGTVVWNPPRKYDNGNRKGASMHLGIGMKDEDIIRRLPEIVGYGKVSVTNQYQTPLFHWRVTRASEILLVLQVMWPWLGERRRQQASDCISKWNLYYTLEGKLDRVLDKL